MSETPGSQALVAMKNVQKTVAEFKEPSAPAKRKQKILTEEAYIEELGKIIQRDFFPDLEKLRAQNAYLEALEKNDYPRLRAICAKYSNGRLTDLRRGMSPATFETPMSLGKNTPREGDDGSSTSDAHEVKSEAGSERSQAKSMSDGHSLDSFLQAYTSEDNSSFEEIIESADQKLRQKFSVLYSEEKLSAEKLAKALTLPDIEKQFDEPDPMRKIETWSYKNKNYIMYVPDGVELTKEEQIERINRRQIISYSNTRLATNPFNEFQKKEAMSEVAKNVSKTLSGKIGIDGNIVDNTKPPQIRGFDLVKTPSPCPGEAFSPLMTWGEIDGTPFRIDGGDTPARHVPGPTFRINETSRREAIGLQLAEKVGEKMRAQKQKAMDTARKNIGSPFIRSSMERLASMSPAARRLATNKLGLRTPFYSPTPTRTPGKSSAKPSPQIVRRKTPAPSPVQREKSCITDNLLQIPSTSKRPKAADFF